MDPTDPVSGVPSSTVTNEQGPAGGKRAKLSLVTIFFICAGLIQGLYASKIFSFFTPTPIVYLTLRQGVLWGFLLWVLSTALIAWINPLDSVLLLVGSGFAGWVAASALWSGLKVPRAIATGVAIAGGIFLSGCFGAKLMHLDQTWKPLVVAKQQLNQNLDKLYLEMNNLAQQSGSQEPQTAGEQATDRQFFIFWAKALAPGSYISMLSISLWSFFILLRPAAVRYGFARHFEGLSLWRSPDHLIWLVIIAMGAMLLQQTPVRIVAINTLIVLGTVYLFQGIAILVFWAGRLKVTPLLRFLGYLTAIIFFKMVAVLLALVGFFDVWFDFRRLNVKAGVS